MTKEFKDLTGMKFNQFIVISYVGMKNYKRYWLCECDCKNKTRKEIHEYNLVTDITKSCGCIRRKTTEQYKIELEEVNKNNGTNIRLKDGIEYINNKTKITHTCTCGKEWDVTPGHILNETKSCGLCYTFKDWCIENNLHNLLKRWDCELNSKNPNEITHATPEKYYFKCPKGIHKSELNKISDITSNKNKYIHCRFCNSFEQWCTENNYQEILDRWDYKLNKKKPNDISYGTTKKYYFKCPRKLHRSELKSVVRFTSGQKGSIECNQCNLKIIKKLYPINVLRLCA